MAVVADLLRALQEGQVDQARALLASGVKPNQKAFVAAAALLDVDLLRAFQGPKLSLDPILLAVTGAERKVPGSEAPPGNWIRVNGMAVIPQPEESILACVEYLLERGASGLSQALLVATRQGLARVVARLLAAGADPGFMERDRTALSLARLYGRAEVIAVLEASGAPDFFVDKPARVAGPEVESPGLVFGAEFWELVAELEAICGSNAVARLHLLGGVELMPGPGLNTLELQRAFAPRGAFVFEPVYREAKLAVLPGKEWSVAQAVMQTNGANCDVSSGDLQRWLLELQREQPFELQTIGRDLLSGWFLGPVREPLGLAERMFRICPDLVNQGCGSVEALARELGKRPARLFLWWD